MGTFINYIFRTLNILSGKWYAGKILRKNLDVPLPIGQVIECEISSPSECPNRVYGDFFDIGIAITRQ